MFAIVFTNTQEILFLIHCETTKHNKDIFYNPMILFARFVKTTFINKNFFILLLYFLISTAEYVFEL